MEFTGERFVPHCHGEIAAEHYHRYFFAASLVSGKRVLDIASGEGYGTHILAQCAAHVTGVDISPEAVANAAEQYAGDNITFLQGSARAIPLPDASVDVVVSFETLEHLHEQEEMLQEIRRVLRDDGMLIMSTPNRPIFSTRGVDQFHVKELSRDEFTALLAGQFSHLSLLGQKVAYGSLLSGAGGCLSLLRRKEESVTADSLPFLDQAMYFIALAANVPLPCAEASFFEYPLEQSDAAIKLHRELAALEERRHAAEERLKTTEEELRDTKERLKTAEAAFVSVIASSSWKLTAPLRRLRRLLRGGPATK